MDLTPDQNIMKIIGMGLRMENSIEKRLLQFDKRCMNVLSIEMTYTLFRLLESSTDFLFFLLY